MLGVQAVPSPNPQPDEIFSNHMRENATARNRAQEIAKLAGELCDKLSASVVDLNVAAEKIAAASEAHTAATPHRR